MLNLNRECVQDAIGKYLESAKNKNARLFSWDICYNEFASFIKNGYEYSEADIDYLSLHLGFFLASFGMMRGSTDLLQKNYRIHKVVVKKVLQKKYKVLHGVTADNLQKNDYEICKLIITLKDEISLEYECKGVKPTDTLITKVLYGVFCCVPAYDRFFRKTMNAYENITTTKFNLNSIISLVDFYISHKDFFESNMTKGYPDMKKVDMCIWVLGSK